MKILVIGGSYFFGRVFVLQAVKDHEVTVVNRGTYSMEMLGARQITGDRKSETLWKNLTEEFDVLVDFCGYEKGDIHTVFNHFSGKIKQYIFISTVDVYSHGGSGLKNEEFPLERELVAGEAGQYIAGKIALEQELVLACGERKIPYTILRPAILYGPFNYAPRESTFIKMLVQDHVLPHITDAGGKFQFVYVKDAAMAVLQCLLNKNAYGQIYNICNETILDYDLFFEELKKAAHVPFREIPMTVNEALEAQIPLLFPLTEAEAELCSSKKSREELGMEYTQISDGMTKTYNAFKNVFENPQVS